MDNFIFNSGIPDLKLCPKCRNKSLHLYGGGIYKLRYSANVGKCLFTGCTYNFTPESYADSIPKGIPYGWVTASQKRNDKNGFICWLNRLYGLDRVEKAVKDYMIGADKDYYSIFWQIDRANRVIEGVADDINGRTGYSGERLHYITAPGHSFDGKENCRLFGEHLLTTYPNKPVMILTDEKTSRRAAVEASIIHPEYIWLASYYNSTELREKIKQLIPSAIWVTDLKR